MAKSQARFQCSECATLWPKWSGQCQDCKSWNSIEEIPASLVSTPGGANWYGGGSQSSIMTLNQVLI